MHPVAVLGPSYVRCRGHFKAFSYPGIQTREITRVQTASPGDWRQTVDQRALTCGKKKRRLWFNNGVRLTQAQIENILRVTQETLEHDARVTLFGSPCMDVELSSYSKYPIS